MASTKCAWCGSPANTLDDDGDVYLLDRVRDAWFQTWVDGQHKIEKVQGTAESLFFDRPECRNEYMFGM